MLVAAAMGAFLAVDSSLPHERAVTIVLGSRAAWVRELELSWTNPRDPASDAALTTRWTFPLGAAPQRLRAAIKVPDGVWDAVLAVSHDDEPRFDHRTLRVTLGATRWWKRDNLERPIVLSLDEPLP